MLSWTINAYLLPLGALTLLGGGLGDRCGRKRLFQTGLLLFTLASLLCAVAPAFGWFLAGRALQGLGAPLLLPNSLAILGASFEGERRGRAVGTWAAVGALAGALGPLIGGWLVDVAGWRTIFLINLRRGARILARHFPTGIAGGDRHGNQRCAIDDLRAGVGGYRAHRGGFRVQQGRGTRGRIDRGRTARLCVDLAGIERRFRRWLSHSGIGRCHLGCHCIGVSADTRSDIAADRRCTLGRLRSARNSSSHHWRCPCAE